MALGVIPARGPWEDRWFETNSSATFPKGALVVFDNAYRVREYASTDSQILGVAQSYSTQSTSMRGLNMVQVAIPAARCTAYADIQTGVAQSDVSIGKKIAFEKVANYMSYASTVIGHASRFSGIAQIAGPIDAARSRVEVSFNAEALTFYSTSSITMTA